MSDRERLEELVALVETMMALQRRYFEASRIPDAEARKKAFRAAVRAEQVVDRWLRDYRQPRPRLFDDPDLRAGEE